MGLETGVHVIGAVTAVLTFSGLSWLGYQASYVTQDSVSSYSEAIAISLISLLPSSLAFFWMLWDEKSRASRKLFANVFALNVFLAAWIGFYLSYYLLSRKDTWYWQTVWLPLLWTAVMLYCHDELSKYALIPDLYVPLDPGAKSPKPQPAFIQRMVSPQTTVYIGQQPQTVYLMSPG